MARLRIDDDSPGASIQDGGRHGWLRFGVTPAGPMDWVAMRTANLSLGNDCDAAAIEIGPGGLAVTTDVPLSLAFAGGLFRWQRDDAGERRDLPPAARVLLRPGETLRVRAGAAGRFAYLAVPGGIACAPVLGSRATHSRSGLGGIDGRALQRGDQLDIGAERILDDGCIVADWLAGQPPPIRVVLGPQDDHFAPDAIDAFFDTEWQVTPVADRMAVKLDGRPVAHRRDFNIVSDGVSLGAVQIAGDGKPMVLMADRQPTGGYAKIAHVCRADIGRFAQLRPGATLRFIGITVGAARAALIALEDQVAAQATILPPLRLVPTNARLRNTNLISGVFDG